LEPLRCHALRRCSLEDFAEFDPSADVESPRSLAACESEGIRPQDLIFIPPEAFHRPDVSPEVAAVRFEFFEAYRQDLLALARCARQNAIAGIEPLHSMAQRDDPVAQYRITFEWFRAKLLELNLQIIPVREDWTTAPRSPEFKRVDNFAASRVSSPAGGSGPSGVLAFQASLSGSLGLSGSASVGSLGSASPTGEGAGGGLGLTMASTWWSVGGQTWRSATSDEALQSMLHQVRTAPGSDWREIEAARRTEDTFGCLRELAVKARSTRHGSEQRMLSTRTKGLDSSFKSLEFDQRRRDRYRDIREMMMPPAVTAANKDGQRRARENNVRAMEEGEAYRQEHYLSRINKQHALEKQIDEERFHTRMKFAQMTMEDRVRWRHNYAGVEEEKANERAGVVEDFRRKQSQLDFMAKNGEEVGAMKREVMNLRSTHRSLDEYRRRRKEEYEKAVWAVKLSELGERRMEKLGGRMTTISSSFSTGQAPFSPTSSLSTTSPPTSPAHARAPSATATPKASAGPILDYSDMDALEQLSTDELRWMQRVTSPKGPRSGGGLSRSSTAPLGLLRGGGGGRERARPRPLGVVGS